MEELVQYHESAVKGTEPRAWKHKGVGLAVCGSAWVIQWALLYCLALREFCVLSISKAIPADPQAWLTSNTILVVLPTKYKSRAIRGDPRCIRRGFLEADVRNEAAQIQHAQNPDRLVQRNALIVWAGRHYGVEVCWQ